MPKIYGVDGAGRVHRELQPVPMRMCSRCLRMVPVDDMIKRKDETGRIRITDVCSRCRELSDAGADAEALRIMRGGVRW